MFHCDLIGLRCWQIVTERRQAPAGTRKLPYKHTKFSFSIYHTDKTAGLKNWKSAVKCSKNYKLMELEALFPGPRFYGSFLKTICTTHYLPSSGQQKKGRKFAKKKYFVRFSYYAQPSQPARIYPSRNDRERGINQCFALLSTRCT